MGWFHCRRNQNRNYGGRVLNLGANGTPGVDGVDDDNNGTTDDVSEIGWPGSDDVANRCFDTWHPQANVGAYSSVANIALRSGDPPYGGYKIRIPGWTGSQWAAQWEMYPGHYIFPGVTEDPNCNLGFDANEDSGPPFNRRLDGGEDNNGNNALDPPEIDVNNNGFADHYEDRNHDGLPDIDTDGDGFLDEDQPMAGSLANGDGNVNAYTRDDWSYYYRPVGYTSDFNNNGVLDPGEPDNGNGQLARFSGSQEPEWPREPGATVVDGNVIWQCFDNRVSLPMIRITVRYRDVGTGLPRQVSIVHSFVE
jgi:hypothetical protein